MDSLKGHSPAHALPPPEGASPAPQEHFKTLENAYFLGYVPRPVVLVCVGENPLAVAWHMPTNKDPFLYAVAIAKENYSHFLLEKGSDFTVNFLRADHIQDILTAGKHSGRQVDKWKLFKHISQAKALKVDALMVKEALLVYECKQERVVSFYDHSIFIGRVEIIHYKKGKLKPQKVKYPLHMGKGYFSKNAKVYTYKI
ncbi:MAG: flavin reductase family protein [Aquificaceae bacterium]|nr:flavin reductase family protein [Aquificaceae bacterium]MCS7278190.1 flavin reductase family protein [Aquificaceae bacterium]MDW8067031.1 flavin reductase family protein [Aquificaceae bacterium]MDW8423370.1 flavin reductase family protein [Aquificaceae bacterium]